MDPNRTYAWELLNVIMRDNKHKCYVWMSQHNDELGGIPKEIWKTESGARDLARYLTKIVREGI